MPTVPGDNRGGEIVVSGEIDVATGTKLRTTLAESLADPEVDRVVADMRSVTFMSSTGIAVLLDAHSEAEQSGKSLIYRTGANRAVLNPLRMSGVDALLHLDLSD